jgi:hypothetical protein
LGPEWLGAELVWGRIDLIPFKKRFLYFNILSIYNLATFAVSKMASYVFVWSKNRADIWDGNEYEIRKWLVLKYHGSGHLQIIRSIRPQTSSAPSHSGPKSFRYKLANSWFGDKDINQTFLKKTLIFRDVDKVYKDDVYNAILLNIKYYIYTNRCLKKKLSRNLGLVNTGLNSYVVWPGANNQLDYTKVLFGWIKHSYCFNYPVMSIL